MNLRRRMELMMTALALGVIIVTGLFSYWLLMGKTIAIEKELLHSQGNAITKLIIAELDDMGKITGDYAHWDDTLNYHQNGSEAYAAETFTAATFDNLKVSHMLYFDNQGLIRSGFTSLKSPDSVVSLPLSDAQAFADKYSGIIRGSQMKDKEIKGIVLLEGVPCLISITRISDTAGTIFDGSMALVRPVKHQTLERIEDVLGCEVTWEEPGRGKEFTPIDKAEYFHAAIGDFTTDGHGASARLNMMDIRWEPVLGLKIMNSNQVWVLSRQILTMIVLITFVSVAGITVLQSWLNNAFILNPIKKLGEFLNDISDYTKLRKFSEFPDQMLFKEDLSVVGKIHGLLRRISEDTIQLQRERHSIRLALDSSMAGTWEYDQERNVIRGDDQTLSLLDLGDQSSEISGELFFGSFSPAHREEMIRLFGEYGQHNDTGFQMECQIANEAGEYRWFLIKGDGLEWDRGGRCTLFAGILLDIEQRKRLESELVHLSYHDKLTGLFNRRYFEEQLEALDKPENLPIAIFVADINGLKLANDAFGHERGDKLLRGAAVCLQAAVGENAIISRWGGDEYAVLVPHADEIQALEIFKTIKAGCKEKGTHGLVLHLALGYSVKKWGSLSLQHVVRSAEEKMYRDKLLENRAAHADFLDKFKFLLNEKGIETYEHCQRVSALGCAIGSRLSLNKEMLEEIALLGDLHDIGKIAMPEELFNKTSHLTDLEWSLVRSHPEVGFRIVALMQDYAHLSQAVLSHHEWVNGSGYPRGLKEQEIPLAARIVTIADAVDVMLRGKPYKEKMTVEEVVEELRKMQGIQFDPVLTEHMIAILEEESADGTASNR